MRYYIIAGEHSGDMHGADLIRQIKKIDHHADFWSCGGPAMSQAIGKPCRVDCGQMAYMGIDFLKKWYTLWRLLQFCQKNLISYRPDVVILIDYSGFNMKLAAFARRNGFQVAYYIPPKIWAHGPGRLASIKRDVDQVLSILPFEAAYYQNRGYHSIAYVGNPLVQKVAGHCINPSFIADNRLDKRPIIALLPGSRLDEIRRILPLMVAQADYFKAYQLVVAGLRALPTSLYTALCPSTVQVVYDQTYDLIAVAKVAIIASGTASLEAALFNLPQVVVYKTHPLAYFFYKKIVTIKHISLVNLFVDQAVVPELIQYQCTREKLCATLTHLLSGSSSQKAAYQVVRQLLGQKNAAIEAAKCIVTSIK
ncbi:MAG: lipid-A-disaccharide synthase [Candidatus Cardinium sp.]|uniref:lipid-A-disaccharide synthase n=1 Tax=Cardinium endosymbiont of Dermatophagoides farinae TaxID=2597823 RepID=UPI0011845736|nr:lipid-A-disaccharide synthase [Cardinium endosymbiont of Dermatophagoides farinae]TSJ81043.1 lipid-A-disaccharide synthase [Cardinium endosymbiont of Dermatophagoides farinae]UWW97073.1 MAG: lipid-A-disaccharide synthase [Candidatus Cardinium sp.]